MLWKWMPTSKTWVSNLGGSLEGASLNHCTSSFQQIHHIMLPLLSSDGRSTTKLNSVAWIRRRTITNEWSPLVDEVSANSLQIEVCHVVSVMDPYGRNHGFLDRSSYFFFQVAPQLYSRGWVDPVPDPLLLIKCGSAGNRAQASGSVTRNSDH
jgi:hypothetical protein